MDQLSTYVYDVYLHFERHGLSSDRLGHNVSILDQDLQALRNVLSFDFSEGLTVTPKAIYVEVIVQILLYVRGCNPIV